MITSICGADCRKCSFGDRCKGCLASNGNPFGEKCVSCEWLQEGGTEHWTSMKKELIDEINQLSIPGMPKVTELFPLCGFYVNLAYPLPNGQSAKLIKDQRVYLECQLPSMRDQDRCFGVVADQDIILIGTYGENGTNPDLILYQKRKG